MLKLCNIMKTKNILSLWAFGAFFSVAQAQEIKKETRGEQEYAVYKVQKGETVFSIAKKYGITQDKFIEHNPAVAQVIKVGDVVHIPLKNKVKEGAAIYRNAQAEAETEAIQYTKHKVAKGQGLIAIARMYNITYEELKKWNDLDTDAPTIVPDQELIVGISTSKSKNRNNETRNNTASANNTNKSTDREKSDKPAIKPSEKNEGRTRGDENMVFHTVQAKQTLFSIAQMYGLKETDIMNENGLSSVEVRVGDKLKIVNPKKMPTIQPEENKPVVVENTTKVENPAETKEPTYTIYTIERGDNITKIQDKFNVRRTEIRYWNGMPYEKGDASEQHKIIAGDHLRIYVPEKLTHTIQKGETIESVKQKYNLNKSDTPLEKWNGIPNGKLKEFFKEGKTLTIYKHYTSTPLAPKGYEEGTVEPMPSLHMEKYEAKKEAEAVGIDLTKFDKTAYTCREGQTLYEITKVHKVKMEDIKKWNNLTSEQLKAGQVLTIYVPKNTMPQHKVEDNKKDEGKKEENPVSKPNNFDPNKSNNNNNVEDPFQQLMEDKKNNPTPKKVEPKKEEPKKPVENKDPFELLNENGGANNKSTTKPNEGGMPSKTINTTPTTLVAPIESEAVKGLGDTNPYNDQSAGANLAGSKLENTFPTAKEEISEFIEKGEAELLETINSATPLVATHRNLPTGTTVFVKNTMNKKETLVQIVEPMNTKTSPDVILQVTQAVLNKLGAGDNKSISVEVKYRKK
jgi:LysM repeat protein